MASNDWNRYGGQPERHVGGDETTDAKRKKQQDRAEVRAAIAAVDRRKAEIAARLKAEAGEEK